MRTTIRILSLLVALTLTSGCASLFLTSDTSVYLPKQEPLYQQTSFEFKYNKSDKYEGGTNAFYFSDYCDGDQFISFEILGHNPVAQTTVYAYQVKIKDWDQIVDIDADALTETQNAAQQAYYDVLVDYYGALDPYIEALAYLAEITSETEEEKAQARRLNNRLYVMQLTDAQIQAIEAQILALDYEAAASWVYEIFSTAEMQEFLQPAIDQIFAYRDTVSKGRPPKPASPPVPSGYEVLTTPKDELDRELEGYILNNYQGKGDLNDLFIGYQMDLNQYYADVVAYNNADHIVRLGEPYLDFSDKTLSDELVKQNYLAAMETYEDARKIRSAGKPVRPQAPEFILTAVMTYNYDTGAYHYLFTDVTASAATPALYAQAVSDDRLCVFYDGMVTIYNSGGVMQRELDIQELCDWVVGDTPHVYFPTISSVSFRSEGETITLRVYMDFQTKYVDLGQVDALSDMDEASAKSQTSEMEGSFRTRVIDVEIETAAGLSFFQRSDTMFPLRWYLGYWNEEIGEWEIHDDLMDGLAVRARDTGWDVPNWNGKFLKADDRWSYDDIALKSDGVVYVDLGFENEQIANWKWWSEYTRGGDYFEHDRFYARPGSVVGRVDQVLGAYPYMSDLTHKTDEVRGKIVGFENFETTEPAPMVIIGYEDVLDWIELQWEYRDVSIRLPDLSNRQYWWDSSAENQRDYTRLHAISTEIRNYVSEINPLVSALRQPGITPDGVAFYMEQLNERLAQINKLVAEADALYAKHNPETERAWYDKRAAAYIASELENAAITRNTLQTLAGAAYGAKAMAEDFQTVADFRKQPDTLRAALSDGIVGLLNSKSVSANASWHTSGYQKLVNDNIDARHDELARQILNRTPPANTQGMTKTEAIERIAGIMGVPLTWSLNTYKGNYANDISKMYARQNNSQQDGWFHRIMYQSYDPTTFGYQDIMRLTTSYEPLIAIWDILTALPDWNDIVRFAKSEWTVTTGYGLNIDFYKHRIVPDYHSFSKDAGRNHDVNHGVEDAFYDVMETLNTYIEARRKITYPNAYTPTNWTADTLGMILPTGTEEHYRQDPVYGILSDGEEDGANEETEVVYRRAILSDDATWWRYTVTDLPQGTAEKMDQFGNKVRSYNEAAKDSDGKDIERRMFMSARDWNGEERQVPSSVTPAADDNAVINFGPLTGWNYAGQFPFSPGSQAVGGVFITENLIVINGDLVSGTEGAHPLVIAKSRFKAKSALLDDDYTPPVYDPAHQTSFGEAADFEYNYSDKDSDKYVYKGGDRALDLFMDETSFYLRQEDVLIFTQYGVYNYTPAFGGFFNRIAARGAAISDIDKEGSMSSIALDITMIKSMGTTYDDYLAETKSRQPSQLTRVSDAAVYDLRYSSGGYYAIGFADWTKQYYRFDMPFAKVLDLGDLTEEDYYARRRAEAEMKAAAETAEQDADPNKDD